jgi:hypothetical protein
MRGEGDFSLPPSERSVYGATVTARSLTTGETLTIARVNMTAKNALREIVCVIDALDDDFRVVSISTPNSIERDLFANRIQLAGKSRGSMIVPEKERLAKIGRLDLLHPDLNVMAETNA